MHFLSGPVLNGSNNKNGLYYSLLKNIFIGTLDRLNGEEFEEVIHK